jgi:uncharacterized protein (TIGR00255 family)
MLISMTGFGKADFSNEAYSISAEIKSVNSRFAEFSFRLPSYLADAEPQFRARLQRQVERGKFSVFVKIDLADQKSLLAGNIDNDKLQAVVSMLNDVRLKAGVAEPISLRDVLSFYDTFSSGYNNDSLVDTLIPIVEDVLDKAMHNLIEQRKDEGINLTRDLELRLDMMRRDLQTVEEISRERVPEARNRMLERIRTLMADDNFDKSRMELEIAILADKLDITEEIVRLRSHFEFFEKALHSAEPSGRKLNFLVQEMHREVNTIGSKANHAGISHITVRMKEAIEIIREQIQNVE